MHVYTKMYVDGKVFNVLSLKFGFDQDIRSNGAVCSLPHGGFFDIKVETTSDTIFYEWAASNNMRKEVKFVFYPITEDRKSRTIELYDAQCIKFDCDFDANSIDPIVTTIRLSPGIIVQEGQVMMEKWWRLTDLSARNAPKEVTREKFPKVLECFYEDLKFNKLTKLSVGKVFLVIKTEDARGDEVTIDLSDDNVKFKYQGELLENDCLEDFPVTCDLHKVKLEVVEKK